MRAVVTSERSSELQLKRGGCSSVMYEQVGEEPNLCRRTKRAQPYGMIIMLLVVAYIIA